MKTTVHAFEGNLNRSPSQSHLRVLLLAGFCCLIAIAGCQNKRPPDQPADGGKTSQPTSSTSDKSIGNKSKGNTEKTSPEKSNTDISSSKDGAADNDTKSYDSRFRKAVETFDQGQADEAWKQVKELMLIKPKDPELIFLAARVLAARNDISGALKMIQQIPEDAPQAGPASGQAAEWLVTKGDLRAAEAKLLKLIKQYPNAVPGLRLLARLYNAEGRRWEAQRYLDRLIRLGDFTMGELLATIDCRDYYDEEATRNAFATAFPEDPYVQFAVIRTKLLRNAYGTYIQELQTMSKENPDMLEPWVWVGTSLLELDRLDELSEWLSKKPNGADRHPEYWYALGGLMLRSEKNENAARCFCEAIRLDRRHVAAYQGLSDALLGLQRIDDAQRVRKMGNDLVTINDLTQQISYNYGAADLFSKIATLFQGLGDDVAAFGWEATGLTIGKLPMTEALKNEQQALRKGKLRDPSVLDGLDYEKWELPTNFSESIPTAKDTMLATSGDAGTRENEIRMEDVAEQLGILCAYDNGSKPNRGWYTIEGVGGGVNAFDYDRDGWPDLSFAQAGDSPAVANPRYKPKSLYRSLGGAAFQDVAIHAGVADVGYGQGIGIADIDQDGFGDLLIANLGVSRIYRNNGDGTFEYMQIPQVDPLSQWNSSLHAADINGDNLPDLLDSSYLYGTEAITKWCEVKNSARGSCNPKTFPPGKNRLLYSNGDWSWNVASSELLESIQTGYTLGTLVTNLDGKEGNDVFFANDVSPNLLLLSKRDESTGSRVLVECAAAAGVAVDSIGRAQACMGIACGDQNRDGLLDLIVTNFYNEVNTLYLQSLPGVFVDGTRRSKLGELSLEQLGFGCQLVDLDNDGWLDFTVANGHIDDLRTDNIPWQMPPQILKNVQGQFRWLQTPSPGKYFEGRWIGRGMQMLDYNVDGRPDLVATHLDRPAALLENRTSTDNHFVQLDLVGTTSERDAVGALIRIECENESWVTSMSDGEGYFGSNEHLIHLGLGKQARIDRISIEWPSGKHEEFENLEVDTRYLVVESVGISKFSLHRSKPE
ncbi:MAG: FG-GAP-like repeat-containing protein [Pirellula sp.]